MPRKMSWPFKLSAMVFLAITLSAVFAPWLATHDYTEQNLQKLLAKPDSQNWMGTDELGRDLFSRILYGARVSLFAGVVTTLIALVIGTVYGAVSGYVGGKTDSIMMRFVDVVFALPDLLMIILVMVFFKEYFQIIENWLTATWGWDIPRTDFWSPELLGIILALTLVSWVMVARVVRGEVLRIKEFAYIEAARALGASHVRIIFHEILPNIWGILIVTLTFRIPVAILAESTLSFIGIGVPAPGSSWGTLANEGWKAIRIHPHLILFPALAIFLTILSLNFLGEGLRDRMDPRKSYK